MEKTQRIVIVEDHAAPGNWQRIRRRWTGAQL
jgi:hypothetical protein